MTEDLITTAWLAEHLNDPYVRIVDCRWVLGESGEGRRRYEAGHIPGAVHLDIDTDLSAKEGPGRHPLPNRRDFERTMARIGVSRDIHVIAYDEGTGSPAPRLWWLIRIFGHDKVSVLDGGLKLWQGEGRPVTTEIPSFREGTFTGRTRHVSLVDKNTVDRLRDDPNVLLIDARAPERYRGEVEPIDARPGHIPGAENFPFTKAIDPASGRFLPPERLREEFEKIGVGTAKTLICYCGSGVTACTNLLALRRAGFDAKLYEGSWSEWSKDPELPVSSAK